MSAETNRLAWAGSRSPAAVVLGHRVGDHRRRGSILIYTMFLMVLLFAVLSLAVDYGHLQLVKTQMQRNADMTARGCLQNYVSANASRWYNVANWLGPVMASNVYNPVDANSGIPPTVTVTWGSWDETTKTFTAGGTDSLMALQVTISRTAANGNAVPLAFPLFNGFSGVHNTCDVSASAIAFLTPNTTTTQTVPGTADVWLAGMPSGSTASWADSTSNASPVFALNVTPGSTLNFNATGATNYSGPNATINSNGTNYNTTHMQGSPDGNYNGLQNGIQTLTAPQNGLIGVFLTNAAPNTVTPPASGMSYSTQASLDQMTNNTMGVQQPFYIGCGQPSAGWATKSFTVPAGATRLYLGVFDGWYNADNPGSLTVTTTQQGQVFLAK